jgi:hypothetical protein
MATLDDFKPYISPEVPGVDVITLENYIRFSINEFCEKSWLIQKSFTHEVDSDDIDSDLNSSVVVSIPGYVKNLRPMWVSKLLVDGQEWNVQHVDLVNDSPDLEMIRESEHKVFHFPTVTTIRLAPFTSSCRLFMSLVLKPTPTATTFDDILLYDWVKGISAGVKADLMSIPNQPWSNQTLSSFYRTQFLKEIGEAKVKVSKDFSKKSKMVQPKEFGFTWE